MHCYSTLNERKSFDEIHLIHENMAELTASAPIPFAEKQRRLTDLMSTMGRVAVAFSAGVDSTVVAKAAFLACGENAVAVIGDSPSLAEGELEQAKSLAEQIGIRLAIIQTNEFGTESYVQNPTDRCFHCKTELYQQISVRLSELNVDVVVNGANLDDIGDYRPGMIAAEKFSVRSPLVEAEFTKQDVRELAKQWELPVWDKPASPCLSSRIAYGIEVTPERVRRIDQAEQFLKEKLSIRELRVRLAANETARIEIPVESIPKLCEPETRTLVTNRLRELGFKYITVDLEGFRSGSLNAAIDVTELTMPKSV